MTPRDLIKANDGLIRSTHISTANHKSTRPITRLYPLEVSSREAGQENVDHEQGPTSNDTTEGEIRLDPREQLQPRQ